VAQGPLARLYEYNLMQELRYGNNVIEDSLRQELFCKSII